MNDEELELARAEAMKADRCFSKGRLRDEFRMKPKPGVEPVSFYKKRVWRPIWSVPDSRLPTNAEKGLFTGITKANTGAIHPFGQGKNA